MEVPVESHGRVVYSVMINVTREEHQDILKHTWYKLRGQPIARGIGNLFRFVANLRSSGENFFPDLVPVELRGAIVTFAKVEIGRAHV